MGSSGIFLNPFHSLAFLKSCDFAAFMPLSGRFIESIVFLILLFSAVIVWVSCDIVVLWECLQEALPLEQRNLFEKFDNGQLPGVLLTPDGVCHISWQ